MQEKDLKFIKNPDAWPMWPFCPLKKVDGSLEKKTMGTLLHTKEHAAAIKGEGEVTIFHAYIYKWPENVENAPTTKYESIEAMLQDGWMVD